MAATLIVHGARDRPVLPRAAGVRRGRHADGGEGMKIAVVGGRLDLHARARVRALARASGCVDELALHDIDPERREVVGGLARRMLDRARLRRRAGRSPATSTRALDGADFVLIQIRVGGQAARLLDETVPLAVRLHRAGDDRRRRASPRRCARCRSCSRSPSGCARARRPDAWIVDFTNPVGIVTRALLDARPPRGRAVQRRDRLPARRSRACSASSRSASIVDQVGLNHLTWVRAVRVDGARRAPGACWPTTATRSPTGAGLPRRLLEELGVVPSYYLRYFYAHDRVLAEQRDGRPARGGGRRDRARAARALPRPRR